jgi:CubicO group peptidase (beta-lactamase class C family)
MTVQNLHSLVRRTRRRFFRDCASVAFAVSSCSIFDRADAESEQWRALTADLEQRLPTLLAQATSVPAVSMALVVDGKLYWHKAFGVKDFESKAPVDNDTIFEAASTSKPVFAYDVMKLCDKGVLDLDTPLTKYTSTRLISGDPRLELITTRRVLSHTSGLPNWRSRKEPLAIQFTPGERWSYSGEGYSYLQSVVTHLKGKENPSDCKTFDGATVCESNFDAYMKASLLVPFGMTSSGYLYREGMARPHDETGKMITDRKATAILAARYGSAGGLHTTPAEYAKFLIEVIDPKPRDAYRLGAGTWMEMIRPQIKISQTLSWGLGWGIQHTQAGDIIFHSGDNPGYKALVAASIPRKTGFIIMTNGDRGFDDVIGKVITSGPMQGFLPSKLA